MNEALNEVLEQNAPVENEVAAKVAANVALTEEQKPAQESNKEYNLRILRERAEKAEQRAAELERMAQQQQPQQYQQAPQEDEPFVFDDESLLEGKHLKKYDKNVDTKIKRLEQQIAQYALLNTEQRLKNQFNDFDDVVSQENLKNFATIYPDEYRSMMSNPDLYGKGKTAYTMIKNLGLAERYEMQEQKLAANKSKPRSAATSTSQVAETPLARVGDYDRRVLTEERKMQLLQQVENAKRNSY